MVPVAYQRRILDDELDVLLEHLPAVAIDGPKGVGKTATGQHRCRTLRQLDSPAVAQVVAADPAGALTDTPPVFLDEWQQVPAMWDAVRHAVDDGANPGSFLLAGSATPTHNSPNHSGAGRIVSVRMRPLAFCERGITQPTVSLTQLLTDSTCAVDGTTEIGLAQYADEICRSGFPGLRHLPARPLRTQLDSYLTRAISRELADNEGISLPRPESLRNWLRAYAAATSTNATWEAIRRASAPGDGAPPSKATSLRYRDWLSSLWLLDLVPAWQPIAPTLPELTRAPKHQLADPALAARLMKVSAEALLEGRGTSHDARASSALGRLFEALTTLTVRTCAQTAEATVAHLRTSRGAQEVDLIVEGHDGAIVGIEVKLNPVVRDEDTRHLHWLRKNLGEIVRNLIVVTTGEQAFRRSDGIAVVPLALLGP